MEPVSEEANKIINEIEELKNEILNKRHALRKLKIHKKRGRKMGQNGIKWKKNRYHVERLVEQPNKTVQLEIIGDFRTMNDIANALNMTYHKVFRAFKRVSKLSESLIIKEI